MVKQYKKLIILIAILLAIPYPSWYGVNYYVAGLVDQTQLIEYGMVDDFLYCNDWRPELLDLDKQIESFNIEKNWELPPNDKGVAIRRGTSIMSTSGAVAKLIRVVKHWKSSIYDWALRYNYSEIAIRLEELDLHWAP